MEKRGYVYILTNSQKTTLYIGVASDLCRRVKEHRKGSADGFTKRYKLHKLVYFEEGESIEGAIKREKQLKKWNRQWKNEMIAKVNPQYRDLYEEVCMMGYTPPSSPT